MAIKVGTKYKCMICGQMFPREVDCDIHRDKEHNIIYVPLTPEDLERLRKFLYFKDSKLLSKSLVETILAYAASSAKKRMLQGESIREQQQDL
jgi:hypothetical protein